MNDANFLFTFLTMYHIVNMHLKHINELPVGKKHIFQIQIEHEIIEFKLL